MLTKITCRMLGLWTVLFLILAGCGGSGSSGFDSGSGSSGFDARLANEQAVIADVKGSYECKTVEGTAFCGPNGPPVFGENSPFSMGVEPQSGSTISCIISTGSEVCELVVGLSRLEEFQPDTAFLLAVRYKHPFSSNWEISSSSFSVIPASNPLQFKTTVPIRGLSASTIGKVDLAVLAYPPTSTPASAAQINALLSDFKADVAFVVTDITVTPNAP